MAPVLAEVNGNDDTEWYRREHGYRRGEECSGEQRKNAVSFFGEQRSPFRVEQEFIQRYGSKESPGFGDENPDDAYRGQDGYKPTEGQDFFNDLFARFLQSLYSLRLPVFLLQRRNKVFEPGNFRLVLLIS